MIKISYDGNMTMESKCILKAFPCYMCYFISTLDSKLDWLIHWKPKCMWKTT